MMTDFFGLRKIAPLVRSYVVPESEFAPDGVWSHRYTIFQLPGLRFGQIGAENNPGRGTTFWIALPIPAQQAQTEPPEKHRAWR